MWLRFQSQTRPATTATGHASPVSALSATSVPAGDVDDPLLNLRSRSHAMMMMIVGRENTSSSFLVTTSYITNSYNLYN